SISGSAPGSRSPSTDGGRRGLTHLIHRDSPRAPRCRRGPMRREAVKVKIAWRLVAVIGIVGLLTPVAQAGNGPGGAPSPIPNGGPGPLACRVIDGDVLGFTVTLTDSYGSRQVRVGSGRLLCSHVVVDTVPPTPAYDPPAGPNALRCYSVST